MAVNKALPLLLLGGAALFAMGGKKKKKAEEDTWDDDFLPPPGPEPDPHDKKKRPKGDPPNPSGDPLGYDSEYWDASKGGVGRRGIRQAFADLGYPVDVNDYPMNILGPKGHGDLVPNYDGTAGKLGGWDDKPSEQVKVFQREYNAISRLAKTGVTVNGVQLPKNMGGLDVDGVVGAHTVNGLKVTIDHGLNKPSMWSAALKEAELKGFK